MRSERLRSSRFVVGSSMMCSLMSRALLRGAAAAIRNDPEATLKRRNSRLGVVNPARDAAVVRAGSRRVLRVAEGAVSALRGGLRRVARRSLDTTTARVLVVATLAFDTETLQQVDCRG